MYLSDNRSFTPFDNADSASDTGSQSEPRSLRHVQVCHYDMYDMYRSAISCRLLVVSWLVGSLA